MENSLLIIKLLLDLNEEMIRFHFGDDLVPSTIPKLHPPFVLSFCVIRK